MTDAVLGIRVHSEGVDKETVSLEKLVEAGRRAEHAALALTKADAQTTRVALQKARAHEAEAKAAIAALRASGSYTREQLSAARAAQLTATAELRAAQAADRHASVKVTVAGAAVREAAALNKSTAAANDNARAMSRSGAALRAANQNFRAGGVSVGNLAAQFQDVAVSASMGQNALQVALAQGTQISAALGPMGAAGAVKALGAAFASVISPLSLATIGITALAAVGLQSVDWTSAAQMALYGVADALEVVGPYAAGAAAGLALLYAPAGLSGITTATTAIIGVGKAALFAAGSMALANPGVALVAGTTAAVAALVVFRDEVTKAFGVDLVGVVKGWGNAMIDIVGTAWNKAIELVETGANYVAWILNKLGAGIKPINLDGLQLDIGSDHLGGLGSALASGASALSGKLRDIASGLHRFGDAAGTAAKKAAEAYAGIARDAEQFIAKQQLERDSYLMTAEAAAAMRYEQEMLNRAANDNITLTAAQRENIHGLASAMAAAEAATTAYKSAVDFAKDTSKGFLSDLRTGLKDGESGWASFAGAAQKALAQIEDKLFDLATNQIVDNLFAGLATAGGAAGGGGAFSGLLAGIFGGARESGGPVSSGRAYLVGERGPELFVPNANGTIVPNGGGSGAPNITIINQTSANIDKAEARPAPGGQPGVDWTVRLSEVVAKEIRRAGSPANSAVQGLGGRSPIRER